MTTTPRNENPQLALGGFGNGTATTRAFSFPDPATVKGAVLADLLAGRRITHLDCWREHGSSRLAHHAFKLRELGWPIRTDEIHVPTSDGRKAMIGEYSLPAETIRDAGVRGQHFIKAARRRA
ncbi:helix-turn-helix domain-containing protein [Aromatoleum evansii]|uniref:Helix-turn-helix domain-containing protein n=1 Tax=Aromatoleum evansii TaxID=59406 RepID=A0ABZ1APE0_AROEV|nr:helix-turn-helix domain-containing protein [Aromatoleum evansii]